MATSEDVAAAATAAEPTTLETMKNEINVLQNMIRNAERIAATAAQAAQVQLEFKEKTESDLKQLIQKNTELAEKNAELKILVERTIGTNGIPKSDDEDANEEKEKKEKKEGIKGFDSKNTIKPEPYEGKPEQFHVWNELFTAGLAAVDEQWDQVLKEISDYGSVPIKEEQEIEIMKNLGKNMTLLPKIKRTLYVSMLQHTKGDANVKVLSRGMDQALDCYRHTVHRGKNCTVMNIMKMMHKAMNPEKAVDHSEVEKRISKWKEDMNYLEEVKTGTLTEDQKKAVLAHMMPEDLTIHLQKHHTDSYETMEAEAVEMADRAMERNPGKKKPVGAVTEDKSAESDKDYYWDESAGNFGGWLCMAVPGAEAPEASDDKGKGKGKGPKGGCYTCGGDHYAAKCPKGKGKGKGQDKGKGKGWYGGGQTYPTYPPAYKGGYGKSNGKGYGKGGYGGYGKGTMNYVHDGSQMTPDGQLMTYPLGNMQTDQSGQQDWQYDGSQVGQWRHIGSVTKGTKKKERKYEASTEFNETIHKAQSYESKNAFNVLAVTGSHRNKAAALEASELDEEKVICIPCSPGGAGRKEKAKPRNHKDPIEAKAKPNKATHVPMNKKMPVHILTRVKEATLNNFNDEKPQKWTRISMAVDSGACDSVADPNQIPCAVKETQASRSGQNFASATGEPIPNLGEMVMPMRTREGTFRSMTVQAAPVTKPLASVLRIVQAGHMVVFDSAGSYIYNKETQELNMLREEDGNYMLDVWVQPTSEANAVPPFGRHP